MKSKCWECCFFNPKHTAKPTEEFVCRSVEESGTFYTTCRFNPRRAEFYRIKTRAKGETLWNENPKEAKEKKNWRSNIKEDCESLDLKGLFILDDDWAVRSTTCIFY